MKIDCCFSYKNPYSAFRKSIGWSSHCIVWSGRVFTFWQEDGWIEKRQDRILGDIGQKVKTRTIPKTVYILKIIFLLILKLSEREKKGNWIENFGSVNRLLIADYEFFFHYYYYSFLHFGLIIKWTSFYALYAVIVFWVWVLRYGRGKGL